MTQPPELPEKPDSTVEAQSNPWMLIAEGIGAYFGKLPVALQKNVTKALGHLLGVPIAYLDGKAREISAASAERARITEAMGKALAKSVKVDNALAEIAIATHANKILRHQRNRISIAKFAADEINNLQLQNRVEPKLSLDSERGSENDISEDWLNAFESEAVNMSSEQMQKLFGKMLAGEIRQPSTFSIRTVKLMGQMDVDVAEIFSRFCSITSSLQLSSTLVVDGRAIVFRDRRTASLHDFGLTHSNTLALHEYGLIIDSNPAKFPYDVCVFRENDDDAPKVPLTYNGNRYVLIPTPQDLGGL